MNVRFFDPGKGYLKMKPEIDEAMQRVLAKGDLILREEVEKFEKNLARFVGTKYAVALNSGTDALVLALKSLQLPQRSEVVVPSHTFKATAGAVKTAGYVPSVVDMDLKLDVNHWTSVFIPVHIAGELMDYSELPLKNVSIHDELGKIGERDVTIIEDACQALGALKNPTSLAQCWSFYPAKILGAYGDAGAITTNDEKVAEYVREARNHFKNDNREFGQNSRMDNLQACILNCKMKYLPEYLEKREKTAKMYLAGLEGVGLPNNIPGRVWQDFIIQTPKRDELFEFLKKEGIETLKNEYPFSPEYPKPPLAAKYEAETLRLPCNADLEDWEAEEVIKKVNEFYANTNF